MVSPGAPCPGCYPLRYSRSAAAAKAWPLQQFVTHTPSFPSSIHNQLTQLSQASNWIFNFIIGMVSPDAFAGIHGYFYLIIAGFCLFSAGLAYFYYVETAGHTLEEIAVAFGDQAFVSGNEEVMETADLKGGVHHEKEGVM